MAILSSLPSSLSSSWKKLLHSFFHLKNFFFFSGHSCKRNQYRADLFSLIISVCWIMLLMEVIHTTHIFIRDWRTVYFTIVHSHLPCYCWQSQMWQKLFLEDYEDWFRSTWLPLSPAGAFPPYKTPSHLPRYFLHLL